MEIKFAKNKKGRENAWKNSKTREGYILQIQAGSRESSV